MPEVGQVSDPARWQDGLPTLLQSCRASSLTLLALALGTLLIVGLLRSMGHRPEWDAYRLPRTTLEHQLLRLTAWLGGLALVAHGGWLIAQAAVFSTPSDAHQWMTGIWATASQTRYGHAWVARLILVAALLVCTLVELGLIRRPALAQAPATGLARRIALALATVAAAWALALQAGAGHAAAEDGFLASMTVALHVLAASAWIGSLPALWLLVARLPAPMVGRVLRRYSSIATALVAVLLASGFWQALGWIGGPIDGLGHWLGTDYGRYVLIKIALSIGLLALAATHRWVLAPKLLHGASDRRSLMLGIGIEIGVGLAAFGVAAHLSSLPPALHEQPIWPYRMQPDWSAWGQAYARRELWRALAWLGAGLLALAIAVRVLAWRRPPASWRLVGLGASGFVLVALLSWIGVPNERLWLRPAYASSYQHSLTGYSATAIALGAARVRRDCQVDCLTADDDATDLSPYNIWGRRDGDLYGWLLATFDVAGHSPFRHGYIQALDSRQRWELIDYFRARVAGRAIDAQGAWRGAYPAPDLPLACEDGARSLRSLRGNLVALVAQPVVGPPSGTPTLEATVYRAQASAASSGRPGKADPDHPVLCRSTSPEAWTALAVVTGMEPQALFGTTVLIDANGWLRMRWKQEELPSSPEQARARRDIQQAPLPASMALGHVH